MWDVHGRKEGPLWVLRSKSKETLCRLLKTMVEETFEIRKSWANPEKQIRNPRHGNPLECGTEISHAIITCQQPSMSLYCVASAGSYQCPISVWHVQAAINVSSVWHVQATMPLRGVAHSGSHQCSFLPMNPDFYCCASSTVFQSPSIHTANAHLLI